MPYASHMTNNMPEPKRTVWLARLVRPSQDTARRLAVRVPNGGDRKVTWIRFSDGFFFIGM
jgi:hypothetical protein